MDEFYSIKKHSKARGDYIYVQPYCKKCAVEKAVKWREENPEAAKINNKKYDMTEPRMRKNRERSRYRIESGWLKQWQRNNTERLKEYQQRRESQIHTITEEEWIKCKEHFDFSCAYCGTSEVEHKKTHKQQLHKDHLIHDGRNDIKNCIPACKPCNSSKRQLSLNNWYNSLNPVYNRERYLEIYRWIRYICKTIRQ